MSFEVGKDVAVPVREQVLRDEDLFGADEAFLTGTKRELVPIVTWTIVRSAPAIPDR